MNSPFTSKEQIVGLISRTDNTALTCELVATFAKLRIERIPFYLILDELEKIFAWKLRNQYRRQAEIRTLNLDDNVKIITQAAFAIIRIDENIEIKQKLLCVLNG